MKQTNKEHKRLLLASFWYFGAALLILCLLGILCAPFLVKALTSFSHAERGPLFFTQTVSLTQILFPFILFMTLASITAGVLHQQSRFFLSSVSSVALNLGYIGGAVVLAGFFFF